MTSYEFDAPSHVMDFNQPAADHWFGGPAADHWFAMRLSPSRMAVQQQNTAAQPPAQARSQPARRSGPTPCRGKRPVRRSSTIRSGQKKQAAARKTQAAAPVQPNSSEQQELEHIKRLQMEVAEHGKKNEASYKAALSGSHLPKRMALSFTVPKEFHFSTDGRVKADNPSDSHKEVDFVSQLRKHAASPAKASKGTTVPKPFNFSQGNKRKGEEPAPYVSMAQQVERFHTRTPARYHLLSRQRKEMGPFPKKAEQLKMTRPHTPRLMTRQRNRPTTVKSSAELEEEELDKLNKFKFKALELNRKILDSVSNPKKPAVKEPTKPEGFDLQIEKRIHDRQVNKKTEEEEHHVFHAQPIPSKLLEEVVGVPPKKVLCPTVPESPAFALKKRVRLERKVEVKAPSPVKSNPMPHFGLPFYPRPSDKSEVEVCPFSFEEREKERILKEIFRGLEDLRNQEVHKARPVRDYLWC